MKGRWVNSILQFALAPIVFRLGGWLVPFMDADEGHFLSGIRCVYHGMAPCRDFFFQQTPLFPYPYAAAMKIFGYGYETAVWTSILFAAGLAVVAGLYFADRSGRWTMSWVGWLLIVVNANILFWAPTI